jgi:hypothetical protein
MLMRRTAITFLICIAVSILTTIGVELYRDASSFTEFGNIHMYVSIGMTVLGAIVIYGVGSGGDAYAESAAASVASDRDEYFRARADDASRGISFGWVVFIAGIVSGALTYGFL